MSTNITVDVLLQRLKQVSDQTSEQNRSERQEREEALQQQRQQSGSKTTRRSQTLLALQSTSQRKAQNEIEQQRAKSAEEHSAVPDLYKKRYPAAQRDGFTLAYTGSGFNSPVSSQIESYPPPSLYPSYPNSATETVWQQIGAGSLRFVVGAKDFQVINQLVPTVSNGFAWRLSSNQQILLSAWNYTRDGDYPPVGEMLLTDTWGGRYLAPRHPMVTSANGVLWLTWEYRLDVATSYGLQADRFGVLYTVGDYSYENIILFVRYDTRSGSIQQKPLIYNQFQSATEYEAMYLANCFDDDPSKAVRALGYKNEYHVEQNKAHFLRAVSAGLSIQYPYTVLQDSTTGVITADSWRVAIKAVTAETPASLVTELNQLSASDQDASTGKSSAVRLNAGSYADLGTSLFSGTGVSPVPSAGGGRTNTQLPVLVL